MPCPGSLLEWHARQEGLTIDQFKVVEMMQDSAFDNYGQAFADGIERGPFRTGSPPARWARDRPGLAFSTRT